MKLIYLLLSFLLFSIVAAAQSVVGGKVISASTRQPLDGASLSIRGANRSTITASDGSFRLVLPSDTASLLISYLGYATRTLRVQANSSDLLIALEPGGTELQQVTVSTGYQHIPLERTTGSFEVIDQQLYNRQVSTDVLSRLDGIVSGVLFDKRGTSNSNFSIRGISTLGVGGVRQPLYIVDNFPYEGDIRNLNPNDVENVTILKDAAAASIWGARAGNGVVVITTRKARFNQPFRLSLQANVTSGSKPDLFYTPVLSAASFIEVERMLFDKGFYSANLNNTRARPVISPVVEILAKQRAGQLTAEEANQRIAALSRYDLRNDMEQYLYRESLNQQYALNMSGGSNNLNYALSAGYDQNLASAVANDYQRISLRSNTTVRPVKNLELQAGLVYTSSFSKEFNASLSPGGGKTSIYPYARLADEQGKPLPLEKDYRLAFVDTAGQGRLLDWHYRPLEEAARADNSTRLQDLLLTLGAKYNFLNSFHAELRYQYERSTSNNRNYNSIHSYFTRNLVNRYTQISGATLTRIIPGAGILDQSEQGLDAHVLRGQLNYSHTFAGKHLLEGLAGAELRQRHSGSSASRTYGYDDNLLTFQNMDYVNRYPIFANLSGTSVIPANTAFSDITDRFVSAFGNLAYTYDGRYTLSASARKDASNLFGVATNMRGVPLWSAGLAWNLSRESFYHYRSLPYLKLRASYGYSGNVNNSLSALTTISYRQPLFNSSTGLPYALVLNPPNPELRWEKVGMLNLGLDFSSAGDRLSGSLEFYHKKASDLLSLVPADMTGGFSTLTLNSASMTTRGADISLNARILPKAFRWDAAFLFSYSKNKVTEYYNEPASLSFYVGDGNSITPQLGQPAYYIVSFRWKGLDPATGNPIGYVKGQESQDYTAITGQASLDDLVFHGPAVPPLYSSLRQSFSYRNLALSFTISGRFNYFFRRRTISYSALFNDWAGHPDYNKRWQKTGDELLTTVPSLVYPANTNRDRFYAFSEVTVEPGDHIRLQDINLSYSLTKERMKKLPARNLRLFLYANHLGIIWRKNKAGLDPDYGTNIPAARTLSFGLRTDF